MSVKSQNKIWNGVAVEQRINLDTGQMEVYTIPKSSFGNPIGSPVKLAETVQDGTKNKWNIDKTQVSIYKTLINQSGTKNYKNDKEFLKDFNNSLVPTFNLDRALQFNDNENYSTQQIAREKREKLFKLNIPLTVSPKTGIVVSSDGVASTQPLAGEQQVEENNGGGGNNPPLQTVVGEDEREAANIERGGPRGSGIDKRTGRPKPGKILRYPLDEPGGPFEYDYISITAHDYEPSGLDVIGKDSAYRNAFRNLGPAYERVIFPMQPQLSETNAVNWSDDQLNPVQGMLGEAAIGLINSDKTDFGTGLKGIQNVFGNLFDTAKEALNETGVKAAVAAYFAGQAVGANLQGRLNGQVINPNLELLFNGPNLRTFNFNFRLTPRFKEESEVIRQIIFAFKRNMSVQRTSANLFLRSPRLFQLEYIYKEGGQHPYLNKFKPCAMTNFQVNYTPDGSYATFDETGSLTAYELTMSFSEIIPIFTDDNEYTENPQDMGF